MGLIFGLLVLLLALASPRAGIAARRGLLGLALGLGWWTSPGVLDPRRCLRSCGFSGGGRACVRLVPLALARLRDRDRAVARLEPAQQLALARPLARRLRAEHVRRPRREPLPLRAADVARAAGAVLAELAARAGRSAGSGSALRSPALRSLVARRRPGLEPLLVAAAMFPLLTGSRSSRTTSTSRATSSISAPSLRCSSARRRNACARGSGIVTARLGALGRGVGADATRRASPARRPGCARPVRPRAGARPARARRPDPRARELLDRLSDQLRERRARDRDVDGFVRYQPHDRLVRRSAYPARVYVHGSTVEARARSELTSRGYRRIETGGFVVYVHDSA